MFFDYFFGSFFLYAAIFALFIFGIIGGIIYFIVRRKKGHLANPYLKIALSREDGLAQFFLLLATFFFSLTLFALNRDLSLGIRWEWIFLISSIAALAVGYAYKAVVALAFGVIGVCVWWATEASNNLSNGVSSIGILIGLLLLVQIIYILGRVQQISVKFKREASVYILLGLIFVTFSLLLLSTQSGLSMLSAMLAGKAIVGSAYLTFSLLVFGLVILALFIFALVKKALLPHEAIGFVLITLLFGMLAFLTNTELFVSSGSQYYYYSSSRDSLSSAGIILAVTFNLAIFLELLGVMLLGYLRKEEWLINFGAVFMFILILVKYFDWFYTSLDKSLFFLGAGIILLLVGWSMERGRKAIIATIKEQNVS